MNVSALAGIRVLDLIDGPGAYGPKLLVGFGADVIRVEPPGGARDRRRPSLWRVPEQAEDPSPYFIHYNAGKRSVTMDIESPADRPAFERLLGSASIVFDNGGLKRAGFDVDRLIERDPPLVVISVTPFGTIGPRSSWRGSDLIVQAMSGMIGFYGYKDERPARFGPAQAEEMSGLAAALGALIGWYGSHVSGRGEFVDVAMQRVCALVSFQMSNPSLYHQFGFTRPRHPRGPGLPAGLFEAKDGFFAFNAWRDVQQTVRFLVDQGTGGTDLQARFEALGAEKFQEDALAREAVIRFVACHTRAELTSLLQSEGLMGLPVHDTADLLAEPFLRERAFFVDVEIPGLPTSVPDSGPPVRMSLSPFIAGRRPPLSGEHTREVLSELGIGTHEPAKARTEGPRTNSRGPLDGIRILDLSWLIAGPLATRLLADFGAQVIKVESRRRMDIGRANRTPLFGVLPGDANSNPDTGGYFQDANAGKLSCTLNLGNEYGRELLRRLVRVSDVILCNLAGDQFAKWGLDYETARALNPGIIMVNMPSMESSGPRKNWRGFGDMFVGVAGLKSISGHPGEPPLPWGHQYADFSSNPFHAAIAIIAALEYRRVAGEGQFIEVSQYESTVAMMGEAFIDYGVSGQLPRPVGNQDPEACPHNIYRCAGDDSWCAIAVFDNDQWHALTAATRLPELNDPALRTMSGRRSQEAAIDAAIERWTSGSDKHEVAETLQRAGVPAGALQTTADLVHNDPTLGADHFVSLEHPSGRTFLVHGNPLRTSHYPADVRRAPLIGEHTFEVLTEILGLSVDEVADYAEHLALE